MTLLVVALLAAAAISLGLRVTSGLLAGVSHPIDRLLLAAVVGISIAWLSLVASTRYQVFEAGLGLLVALAPVGVYDVARWWGRSRRPFGPWVRAPLPVVAVRCLITAAVLMACAGAVVAIAGVIR